MSLIYLHVFDYGHSTYLFHTKMFTVSNAISVADPGLPGGTPTPERIAPTDYFTIFFAGNYVKMREFGPLEGLCVPNAPSDPPMHLPVG